MAQMMQICFFLYIRTVVIYLLLVFVMYSSESLLSGNATSVGVELGKSRIASFFKRDCRNVTSKNIELSLNELNRAYVSAIFSSVTYLQYEMPQKISSLPGGIAFQIEGSNKMERTKLAAVRRACLLKEGLQRLGVDSINAYKQMIWKTEDVIESISRYVSRTLNTMRSKFKSKAENLLPQQFISGNHTTNDKPKQALGGNTFGSQPAPQDQHHNLVPPREARRQLAHHQSRCLPPGVGEQRFTIRWFLADFREGKWHDTEVLLAESANSDILLISFRGSDTAADLITNSQRMESTRYSDRFQQFGGKMLRGIRNAYAKVHTGDIIRVPWDGHKQSKHAEDRSRTPSGRRSAFDATIGSIFDQCLQNTSASESALNRSINSSGSSSSSKNSKGTTNGAAAASAAMGREASTPEPQRCTVQGQPLSGMLVETVLQAVDAGRTVLLTGHSLGAALAVQLALDALTNHAVRPPRAQVQVQDDSPHRSSSASTSSHVSSQFSEVPTEGKLNTLQFRDFSNMFVTTFGEPEFADSKFFDDVFSDSEAAQHFFQHQVHPLLPCPVAVLLLHASVLLSFCLLSTLCVYFDGGQQISN